MSDHEPDAKRRRLVESVIPKIIKRAVERGVERAQDAPADVKSFISDMRLPKELAHYLLAQVDETKNGLFRVVAHELRDFLEATNFSGEVQKLLTTVQFEVNTTIRFTPNERKSGEVPAEGEDQKLGKPEVKTEVHVRREERERRRAERIREREARQEERRRQREGEAASARPSSIPPPPRVPEAAAPDASAGATDEDPADG